MPEERKVSMIDSIVIFDIDGVLADCQHRRHFIEQEPPDWAAFYATCKGDPVIVAGAGLWRLVVDSLRTRVAFCTGRSESVRSRTAQWLRYHGFGYRLNLEHLLMRPIGDHRPDYVLKPEMVEKVQFNFGLPVSLVVDDSQAVVDALVARGFTCLHFRWPGEDASRATTRRHNEKLAGEAVQP